MKGKEGKDKGEFDAVRAIAGGELTGDLRDYEAQQAILGSSEKEDVRPCL
jgi:hypothetical protein